MAEPTPTAEPTEKDARDLQAYYDGMKQERKRLIVPLVSIILFLYFFQQVLTNFTPAMDGFITENMTIAFAYTIAMFFAIIAVTMIYSSRMNKIESQLTPPNLEEIAARYNAVRDDVLADAVPARKLVDDAAAEPVAVSQDTKDV